jgi:hypothetical protein
MNGRRLRFSSSHHFAAQVTVEDISGQEEVITSSWTVCFKTFHGLCHTGRRVSIVQQ